MAKQNQQEQDAPAVAPEFIAQGDTMTGYGLTVDQIVEAARENEQKIQQAASEKEAGLSETIAARNREIESLQNTIREKNKTMESLTMDLGVARMLAKQAKASGSGFERLADGGLRVLVNLDVDEATPLLSWAEGANEDPATYIAAQIRDALVAVTSS